MTRDPAAASADSAKRRQRTARLMRWLVPGVFALGALVLISRWQIVDALAWIGGGTKTPDLLMGLSVFVLPVIAMLIRNVWLRWRGRGVATRILGWFAAICALLGIVVAMLLATERHESNRPGTFRYYVAHHIPYFEVGVFLGLTPMVVLGLIKWAADRTPH